MTTLAFAASLLGLLGLFPFLPSLLRGPAMLCYVLVAPGAAIMLWLPEVAGPLRRALVPVLSLAVVILVSYLAVLEGMWHPSAELAVLEVGTLGSVLTARLTRSAPHVVLGRTEGAVR
jgi:hypothetical protein